MLGLETAVGVVLTELVHTGLVRPQQALAALSWQPARIASLAEHGRPVTPGNPANLTVIDPERRWTVHADDTASRSRNTPFAGWELRGKVRHTMFGGELVVHGEVAQR